LDWQEFFVAEPFGFPAADAMHARQMWATMKASSTSKFQAEPHDFLLRPPEVLEVEVDPVEYLSAIFGPPPPRPGAGAQGLPTESSNQEVN